MIHRDRSRARYSYGDIRLNLSASLGADLLYGSLAAAFDSVCISNDGAAGTANCGGRGYSYSAQALAVAGLTPGAVLSHGGLTTPGRTPRRASPTTCRQPTADTTLLARLPCRNTPQGTSGTRNQPGVFVLELPADPTCELRSIELPATGRVNVFALAVAPS